MRRSRVVPSRGLAATAGPRPACKQCKEELLAKLELSPHYNPANPPAESWLNAHAQEHVVRYLDDWTCRMHHQVGVKGAAPENELDRALSIRDMFPNRKARRAAKLVGSQNRT